jgi:hypothetical protein
MPPSTCTQRNRAWLTERDGLHVVDDGAHLVATVVGWPEGPPH